MTGKRIKHGLNTDKTDRTSHNDREKNHLKNSLKIPQTANATCAQSRTFLCVTLDCESEDDCWNVTQERLFTACIALKKNLKIALLQLPCITNYLIFTVGKYQFHEKFVFPLCKVLKNRAIISGNTGERVCKKWVKIHLRKFNDKTAAVGSTCYKEHFWNAAHKKALSEYQQSTFTGGHT